MPKVNEDYINKKKTQILDAAFRMFQQKPLYEITMLDVIKEAGISKGEYIGTLVILMKLL